MSDRLRNARTMRADKELDADDYLPIKNECESRTNKLKKNYYQLGNKERGVDKLINEAIDGLLSLDTS